MIKFARLNGGNIGRRGNVSCAFVESKLGDILPNTPEATKTIVFEKRRGDASKATMKSFRCRRFYTQRFLELHQLLGIEEWEFTLSQDNLSLWPIDGNLLQLVQAIPPSNPSSVEDGPSRTSNANVDGPSHTSNSNLHEGRRPS